MLNFFGLKMRIFSQSFNFKNYCLHDLPLVSPYLVSFKGTSCLKHISTYKLYHQTFTTLQWQLERFHLRFHVLLQLKYLL